MKGRLAGLLLVFSVALTDAAVSQGFRNYVLIGIEWIGDSDKPVTPVVVSDSALGAEWFRRTVLEKNYWDFTDIHIVNNALVDSLISYASGYAGREPDAEGAATVAVYIITPQISHRRLFRNREASLLLDGLKEISEEDESLVTDFSHFQMRVIPYTPRERQSSYQ